MDENVTEETSWVQDHLGKLLTAFFIGMGSLLMAMAKWTLGRELGRHEAKVKDHEDRLRSLESTVVTKDDMRELRELMSTQHGQILDAIFMHRTGGR